MTYFKDGFAVYYTNEFRNGFMPVQVIDPSTMIYVATFVSEGVSLPDVIDEMTLELKRKIVNSRPALSYC